MSTPQPEMELKPHDAFWFEDGNLVLQAESTLFNVHRAVIAAQSEFLKSMLSLPVPLSESPQDATASHPLVLPDTPAAAFGNLLAMLYRVCGEDLGFTADQYVGIFLVAHRLQFATVLRITMRRLETLINPARRLHLGLLCGLDEWQRPAFQQLVLGFTVEHDDPTSRLGDRTWLKVHVARARVVRARVESISSKTQHHSCGHLASSALVAMPTSPRSQFYDAFYKVWKNLPVHDCCATDSPQAATVINWMLDYDKEIDIVNAVWSESSEPVVFDGSWNPVGTQ